MSLTRKIAHNTAIQFAGKIIGTILALVTLSIMMRYLGKLGFGQYATTINFLSVFAILIDLGLYLIVTREISREGADDEKLISNVLTFRLSIGIIVLGLAPVVALFMPYSNITKLAILVNASAFLFLSFAQILTGLFQKHLRMEKVSIAEVAGRVFWLLSVLAVVSLDLGLLWIVGMNTIGCFLNFVILYLFSRRYIKIRPAFDFDVWKRVWKSAAPLAVNVILNLVYFKAGIIILTVLKDEGDVGILGAAQKILENLITFSAIFAGLLFPIFAKHINKNKTKFKNVYQKGFDALAILVLPLVTGTLFLGREMIVAFGGEEFAAASGVLKIMMFAVGAIFFGNLFGNAVVAADLQKKLVKVYIVNAIIAVTISLVLIPYISYYGAAISTLITEFIMCFAGLILISKTKKVLPSLNIFVRALVSSLCMALILTLLPKSLNLAFLVVIPSLAYFVILYLLKGISKETILEIVAIKKQS